MCTAFSWYGMTCLHQFVLLEEQSGPPPFVEAMQMEAVLPPKLAALVNDSKSARRCQACFEIDLPGQSSPLQIFDQVTRTQSACHIQHTVPLKKIPSYLVLRCFVSIHSGLIAAQIFMLNQYRMKDPNPTRRHTVSKKNH